MEDGVLNALPLSPLPLFSSSIAFGKPEIMQDSNTKGFTSEIIFPTLG